MAFKQNIQAKLRKGKKLELTESQLHKVPIILLPKVKTQQLQKEFCRTRDLFEQTKFDSKLFFEDENFFTRGTAIKDELAVRGVSVSKTRTKCGDVKFRKIGRNIMGSPKVLEEKGRRVKVGKETATFLK